MERRAYQTTKPPGDCSVRKQSRVVYDGEIDLKTRLESFRYLILGNASVTDPAGVQGAKDAA